MKQNDVQKQVFQYQQYLMEGMSAKEAFNKAFPNGIPTQQDRLKEAAKEQQKSAYGQLGGVLTGALGSKAVYDAVTGKPILGGLFSGSSSAAPAVTEAAGAAANATSAGAGAAASSAGSAAFPVGTAQAGTLMSDGTILPMSSAPSALNGAPVAGAESTLGAAAPYLGLVGAGVGAYGLHNAFKANNSKAAALSGAGMGAGLAAAAPLLGLGPVGWGGLALAAALGGGGGAALNSILGNKMRWKEEQDNVQGLVDRGVTGWDQLQRTLPQLSKGRSIEELVAIEEANKAAGLHNNVDFARTRDEKYLKPEDIWGYSNFGEKYGNDWFGKYSEQERRGIAQQLLDAGAVQEGRGQLQIDWTKLPQQQAAKTDQLAPTAYNKAKIKQNAQFGDKLMQVLR